MSALKKYFEIYREIGLERVDLFNAIKNRYNPESVLYPGSSVHITLSFIFQNVTYVDPSPLSSDFFKSMEEIKDLIAREARYKQKPYFRYFNRRLEECNEIAGETFDLVFTSFSGKMIEAGWKFLNYRGVYISNNHFNELSTIDSTRGAAYQGYFSVVGGKYVFTETQERSSIKEPPKVYKNNESSGVKYLNNERYYVIRNCAFV